MNEYTAAGFVDVTEQYLENEANGTPNNPFEMLEQHGITQESLVSVGVAKLRFMNSHHEYNGDLITSLEREQIDELTSVTNEFQEITRKLVKLQTKHGSMNREAGKLMRQILKSRGAALEPGKTALGISYEDGTLYIGKADKVHKSPDAPPNIFEGDKIIGKLTKSEDSKIADIGTDITELESEIKGIQAVERSYRVKVANLYERLFGREFLDRIKASGKSFDDITLVINQRSGNVRLR